MNSLIEYRKQLNLTQSDVAKRANVSRASYTNIENGRRRPSPELAQKLAEILNFDWTIFFTAKGE